MKRFLAFSLILAMGFGIVAFQCSSTELTSAKLYIQQKQYDKAKEALQREIEKNPKSDEGFYLLGLLHGDQGDIEEMIDAYDKSLAISNKFAKNIKDNKMYHWASSFNRGVSYFNKASKTNDKDSTNMFFDKSVESFKFAIMCEPDSADTYTNLAFAYINMGENEKALDPISKQIALIKKKNNLTADSGPIDGAKYSGLLDSYALEGEILTKLGAAAEDKDKKYSYYNKAIDLMKEAKNFFPDDPSILLHLSNSYIATDQLDVAMESFKEGVAKDPENKYYRFNYGSMLLTAEEYENAAVQLKKAVDIDPEYENAIYNLAVTYVKWGATLREEAIKNDKEEDQEYLEKYKLALPYLEKYVQIDPSNGQFWDLLFKVYTNLNMTEKAEAAMKKAEELNN